jgi:23S rRNA (cytosine1962-C5)-methyltransferase
VNEAGKISDTMNRMAAIVLKAGREKSVKQHHPWIFSGAVANVYGNPKAGETVDVLTTNGNWLGRAAFNPFSNIRARLWTWDETETIDTTFFKRRLSRAIGSRRGLYPEGDCLALRLVYAESDGIPGLIVDRYADWLVVQFLTAGVEYWRDVVIDTLVELTGIRNIYERSDVSESRKTGFTFWWMSDMVRRQDFIWISASIASGCAHWRPGGGC